MIYSLIFDSYNNKENGKEKKIKEAEPQSQSSNHVYENKHKGEEEEENKTSEEEDDNNNNSSKDDFKQRMSSAKSQTSREWVGGSNNGNLMRMNEMGGWTREWNDGTKCEMDLQVVKKKKHRRNKKDRKKKNSNTVMLYQ
jgi:hypothetical protein